MTARELTFAGVQTPQEAARFVLRIRFAEALERQGALAGDDNEAVHAFRLACKRLRYAIERFELPVLQPAADALKRLSDELGSAHDCIVLARRAAACAADLVAERALLDRDRCVRRAAKMWRENFTQAGAFAALAEYTGFSWSRR